MTTQAIATAFTDLCRKGQFEDAERQYWSDDVVSIEFMPGDWQITRGRDHVKKKHAWWEANTEMHGLEIDGPYVNGDQFAVRFTMDGTMNGERSVNSEIAVYTVKDGKITEERFFGPPMA